KSAGKQTITAADATLAAAKGTSKAVSVKALTTVDALTVTGFASPDVSGVAHRFTVTAVDQYGNKVAGYRGKVHITSTDTDAVLPAAHAFTAKDKGAFKYTATLVSLDAQSLTASDAALPGITGMQSGISVVSAAT